MNRYRTSEEFDLKSLELVKHNFKEILEALGEDITRDGLARTPERVAKSLHFMTQGYQLDALQILKSAVFDEHHSEMVIVKDIELYSLCEHHMLPFYGRAHIAYIPNGKIVGLSKLARVVDVYSRRLQVQERLTTQVRDCIQEALQPLGVAVVIEAKHLCMMMRGVQNKTQLLLPRPLPANLKITQPVASLLILFPRG